MKPRRAKPDLPSPLLTAAEAASVLGIHVNTLKRWRAIPFYRIGSRGDRRYELADILAIRTPNLTPEPKTLGEQMVGEDWRERLGS